jgi:hypothetical protein
MITIDTLFDRPSWLLPAGPGLASCVPLTEASPVSALISVVLSTTELTNTPGSVASPCCAASYETLFSPEIMPKKSSFPQQPAGFIETMDCLPVSRLPEGPEWTYEITLGTHNPYWPP